MLEDVLSFGIPALVVFFVGLMVSARDGYNGLTATLWHLIKQPENLHLLSLANIIGLLLYAVGLTIAIVAAWTLGTFYSSTLVTREDHRLITHGLYRYCRHPIYLGVIIVVCFGVPIYSSSLYGFLILSLLIPIFLNRIRIEERLLIEQFGSQYEEYRKTTSKLIPFLY